jgi:hypothetical protein
MRFKVLSNDIFPSLSSIDGLPFIPEAVKMARESNLHVIQQLQKELDTYLQQVREYTEQDKHFIKSIEELQ